MNLKQILIKSLEYTPFLSTFPGICHLYIAWNNKENLDSTRQFALRFFNTDIRSPDYSPFRESLRGSVCLIPLVNLILIPLDFGIYLYCAFLKPRTQMENLQLLKHNLEFLQTWYDLKDSREKEVKEGKALEYLCYDCASYEKEENKIIQAFHEVYQLIKKSYRFSEPTIEDLLNTFEDPSFEMKEFYHSVVNIHNYFKQKRTALQSVFFFIGVALDCHECGSARYVYTHCKRVITEIEKEIAKLYDSESDTGKVAVERKLTVN